MKNITDVYEKIKKEIYDPSIVKLEEEYRIVTYPGVRKNRYLVSNLGKMYTLKFCKVMRCKYDDYLRITLATDNESNKSESRVFTVHRIVAWEFCEGYSEEEGKIVVNHKNLCKYDNRAENLEWCTYEYNTRHEIENSNRYDNRRALTYDECVRVCELLEEGLDTASVYRTMFNDDSSNIQKKPKYQAIVNIYTKGSYREISSKYKFNTPSKKQKPLLKKEQIHEICKRLEYGETTSDIINALHEMNTDLPIMKLEKVVEYVKNRQRYVNISEKYNF